MLIYIDEILDLTPDSIIAIAIQCWSVPLPVLTRPSCVYSSGPRNQSKKNKNDVLHSRHEQQAEYKQYIIDQI